MSEELSESSALAGKQVNNKRMAIPGRILSGDNSTEKRHGKNMLSILIQNIMII